MDIEPTSTPDQKKETFGETFRGADRGMFKWSQSISDLDVVIELASCIKSSSDIKVETTVDSIDVRMKISDTQWYTLMADNFCEKIKPSEVVWTFEPEKLSIHIEKAQDKWWDSLLLKEPKINLEEIELSRPVSDLSQEEEMTLQQLWNNHLNKICHIENE